MAAALVSPAWPALLLVALSATSGPGAHGERLKAAAAGGSATAAGMEPDGGEYMATASFAPDGYFAAPHADGYSAAPSGKPADYDGLLKQVVNFPPFDAESTRTASAHTASTQAETGSDSSHGLGPVAAEATARTSVVWQMAMEGEAEGITGYRGAWKWGIRKRTWDYMELHRIAMRPTPAHDRIPNFTNSLLAAVRAIELPEFQRAKVVKVGPEGHLRPVREAVLRANKTLLVPQMTLESGSFARIDPEGLPYDKVSFATTQDGVKNFGKPVGWDDQIKVDLIVAGSVAVDPTSGARVGRGSGLVDLEYALLGEMHAVDNETTIVTLVHDCQVVEDIPARRMLEYDVPLDIIVTPTQLIRVEARSPRPPGIFWNKISMRRLRMMRTLVGFKARVEAERGVFVPFGPDEVMPPFPMRYKGERKDFRGKKVRERMDRRKKKQNQRRNDGPKRRSGPRTEGERPRRAAVAEDRRRAAPSVPVVEEFNLNDPAVEWPALQAGL